MNNNSFRCRICNNSEENEFLNVKELMFGLLDEFSYIKCNNCGCLQIHEYPSDISKFYPDNYYSKSVSNNFRLMDLLKNERDKNALTKKGLLGKIINKFIPGRRFEFIQEIEIDKSAKILDIGCGSGDLLKLMHKIGFNNLKGIDPYIDNGVNINDKLIIEKASIFDIDDTFDFIMMHHALEHMENPHLIFKKIKEILSPNGTCLIRIPISDSYAFETYRENWVQLDAPRHYYLHTEKSIRILCESHGLELKKIVHDSFSFQFWGSEMYRRNLPLKSNIFIKLYWIVFVSFLKGFNKKSIELNKTKSGDQAAFYICNK